VRRGYEFNYKLLGIQVQPHGGSLPSSHSFVDLKQENVVLTAIKKAEDSDALLFRFYEWAGKTVDVQITVPGGATEAVATNLLETPEGPPLPITGSNEITVPVHPYENRDGPSEVPHRGKVKNQRYRGVSSMVITRSTSTLCNR